MISCFFYACVVWASFKLFGSRFHPATYYSSYWAFLGICSVLVFGDKVGLAANLYIFSTLCVFLVGAYLLKDKKNNITYIQRNGEFSGRLLIFLSLANFVFALFVVSNHLEVGILQILYDFAGIARKLSLGRYEQGMEIPAGYFIAIGVAYSLIMFVPLMDRASNYWVSGINFIVVLFLSALLTTKLNIFVAIMLLFFSVVVRRQLGGVRVFSPGIIRLAVFSFAGVYLIFLSYSMLRYGWNDFSEVESINQKMANYMLGQMVAFSDWISFGSVNYGLKGLFYTFGINLFGEGNEKISGVFNVYVHTFPGVQSNVYTLFRFVVEDVGVFGGYAFFFILGGCGSFLFERVKRGERFYTGFYLFYLVYLSWSLVSPLLFYGLFKMTLFLYFALYMFSKLKLRYK